MAGVRGAAGYVACGCGTAGKVSTAHLPNAACQHDGDQSGGEAFPVVHVQTGARGPFLARRCKDECAGTTNVPVPRSGSYVCGETWLKLKPLLMQRVTCSPVFS